ncbi:HAMP domain-containing histidine kinase [Hyphomonas sp. WL0036]|uniref:sensor histidine kinase n=1 Tax=Hyphomonas sediminis TaxID=2866160 RepID=UPI001C80974A|nr:HAMP domain-containing sensor histidine kinase [Hyphomonas sediminis]MBY9065289.1 HAMP domain-containing histidine kinase [Hyphomonas sediminis]
MSQKRLQFVHVAWLALCAGSGFAGLIAGAPVWPVLAITAFAVLPGFAGIATPAGDTPGRGIVVICWTVVALAGLILSGGGVSPLTVLLVLPPLAGLLAGARRMAAEAGVFATLALFMALVAGGLGWLPSPPEWTGALAAPLAFSGLVTAALMVWMLVHSGMAEKLQPFLQRAGHSDQENSNQIEPARLTVPVPQIPAKGAAIIEVTPEGRLRAAAGDTFGMTTLRPGTALTALFEPGSLPDGMTADGETILGEAKLVTGQRVLISGERRTGGTALLLFAPPNLPADPGEEAREAYEAELKRRTAFFASLGHDLRTPLHAILGYAEMMQAELMGPMPEAYADYPAIIHESGTDLLLMVDDILDLSRAEAGEPRLDPEPVDLTASAESVIRQMTGHASRASVTLKLKATGEVWAEADARAVRQIWQNLVSNAIKYSGSGKTVTLETRLEDGAAILSVQDRGAGIPASDLARLTQPFTQAKGAKPGTGLGLSVVRRFAELHGGELRLSSRPGRGTKAEVILPRASEADLFPLDEAAQ